MIKMWTPYEQWAKSSAKVIEVEEKIGEILQELSGTSFSPVEIVRNDDLFIELLNKFKFSVAERLRNSLSDELKKYSYCLIYWMLNEKIIFNNTMEIKHMQYALEEYCDVNWEEVDFESANSCDGQFYFERKEIIDSTLKKNLFSLLSHDLSMINDNDWLVLFAESEEDI